MTSGGAATHAIGPPMASTADPKNPSSMPRSFCANCFEGQKVVVGFPLLVRYAVMGTSRPTSADDSSFAKLENRYSLPSGVTTVAVHLDTAPSTNQFGSRKMSLATGRAPRRPSLIPWAFARSAANVAPSSPRAVRARTSTSDTERQGR